MVTAYYAHEDCLKHVTPDGHPEQVARLEVIGQALGEARFGGLRRVEAPLCEDADILLCHPWRYLDRVVDTSPVAGFASLDADTHMSPGSLQAARRGVGGNIAAIDTVLAGDAANAFVGCRPPGHHAETDKAMGFCLFGNIAIGAKHALQRRSLSRVAIVDFDVHHGNGTQDLLWDERRVLFCSSHQMPLYPGSGAVTECGPHNNILNLPFAPESDGAAMRAAYENRIFPAIDAFKPELILISAGFDAHRADPLANLNWEVDDFVWLTHQICDLADKHCQGRVVSTLEGGYDLTALAICVAAHVETLMERGG
ncbi:MAG: histone deacetylase family protein [Paracoccaceae bacterium]